AAMAATVMGNHPVALRQEIQHLIIPVVRAQRPAVVENDRLRVLRTPVLVEDAGAVAGGDESVAHGNVSCVGRMGKGLCKGIGREADGGDDGAARDEKAAPRRHWPGEGWKRHLAPFCGLFGRHVVLTWTVMTEAGMKETWLK